MVLENLAHAYTHPSILDVKLGTVLYSPDASLEKRERMERASRGSTSWETGIRLTGCQVCEVLLRSPSSGCLLGLRTSDWLLIVHLKSASLEMRSARWTGNEADS